MKKIIRTFLITTIAFSFFSTVVKADDTGACGILPCGIYNGGPFQNIANSTDTVSNFIRVGLVLVFAGLLIFGLFLIVSAALTIIRSEGDESKVEAGAKAIRGVFIGLGIMVVGLFGLVIMIALFDAGGVTNVGVNAPSNVLIPLITN